MIAGFDKAGLRAHMRALRRRLAVDIPDAALRAASHLPPDLRPRVVAGYHPQGAEIDPGPVAAAFRATVVLPVGEARDRPLSFRLYDPAQPTIRDAYGMTAPTADAPALRPDLVIVPLLAFDANGGRLGQGAGAYDRTIANLRAAGEVFILGLAYSGQRVAQLPAEPHDERLDAVLTETGYSRFR